MPEMLKSTHRSHKPQEAASPLPSGWTEHKAPTGHPYYYNATLKKSTYTRPTEPSAESISDQNGASTGSPHHLPYQNYPSFDPHGFPSNTRVPFQSQGVGPYSYNAGYREDFGIGRGRGGFHGGRPYQDRRKGHGPEDRPKSKIKILQSEPWILVRTRFGRRFVHNSESRESFWKIPEHLLKAVEAVEAQKHVSSGGPPTGVELDDQDGGAENDPSTEVNGQQEPEQAPLEEERTGKGDEDSDEYEEVTDDEQGGEGEDQAFKRQKVDERAPDQPQEFNEDDIAFQLAAMGQDYGLDPGEYGDEEADEVWEDGAEGLPLTEEDSAALFRDMLDDFKINPYWTWEKVIEDGKIIEDGRYTVLPNTKTRKEVWAGWTRIKIQETKEQREKAAKQDPRIPYLAFLQTYATPKLYWPEFRRKFKKEPEMRDAKLSDKEKEKLYRDHISRLKMPEPARKSDLSKLLKSLPLSALSRSTSLSTLPVALLTDIRYISLAPGARDPLLEAYISTLEPAPAQAEDLSVEEETRRKGERERRERALADREKRVAEEKRRQRNALQFGKGRLREEEEEIARAMRVGKEGLRAQLGGAESDQNESK